MIQVGLAALLNNTPAIQALCGTRIYPDARPPGVAYPAMTWKLIAAKPSPTLSTSGFQRHRFEFCCFGVSPIDAETLRETLRKALEGYNGVLSDGTLLQDAQFIQALDSYEDDPRVYERMIELYLFFNFST